MSDEVREAAERFLHECHGMLHLRIFSESRRAAHDALREALDRASSGDGTPGPARTNAPEFPKYEGYDGPRIVQRLDYAADVLDLLAEWIGAKPSLPHRDLIQLAKDFRSMADEELEELWPK